jgi:hypothetical protein
MWLSLLPPHFLPPLSRAADDITDCEKVRQLIEVRCAACLLVMGVVVSSPCKCLSRCAPPVCRMRALLRCVHDATIVWPPHPPWCAPPGCVTPTRISRHDGTKKFAAV